MLGLIVCCVSGSDAILLGAETLRGLYPVETISVVRRICAEVSVSSFQDTLIESRDFSSF